jgi:hypothetical protein
MDILRLFRLGPTIRQRFMEVLEDRPPNVYRTHDAGQRELLQAHADVANEAEYFSRRVGAIGLSPDMDQPNFTKGS